MAELRYNPLLDDYTMINSNRNKRPDMPSGYCAFCPQYKNVEPYDVLLYPNDFPILSTEHILENKRDGLYHNKEAYGYCDVVLYTPDHNGKLYDLSDDHLLKLVDLWINRFLEIKKDKKIKYFFPFENRGKEVGTTMPHPHGQIYSYSFIPLKIKEELNNAQKYFFECGNNLYDEILKEELRDGKRIIYENNSFTAFIPYFAGYPFETYVFNSKSIASFEDFDDDIKIDFVDLLKNLVKIMDSSFNREFPYMMGIFNKPINSEAYADADDFFRFHLKFAPVLRSENSIKYNASSETLAGAFGNPLSPEKAIEFLRK